MTYHFPKLRALDIRSHHQQGQSYYVLRDPQQVTDQPLLVPQAFGPLLALCDGTNDLTQLVARFQRYTALAVDHAFVQEFVQALDEAFLLESDRYRVAHQQASAEFRSAPYRQAALAGLSYPKASHDLWQHLQDYLEGAESVETLPIDWSYPVGILSPHIDYQRGGPVYAQVWKRAAQAAREAELVILLGTDHYGSDPFTLTRQNYATPYGTLPTARAIVDELAAAIGETAAFAGELRHRGEHSLELVAVWLHHMRAGEPCDLVPILCGGFHRFFRNGEHPHTDHKIQQVLATLRRFSRGRRTLVIASGDLAHVGPAFDGDPLDSTKRTQLRQADEELIAHMCAGNAEGFFTAIKQVQDQNNVCGVAPIYLTMQTIGATSGEAVGYATCPADDVDTSVVTVGGMIFHGQ